MVSIRKEPLKLVNVSLNKTPQVTTSGTSSVAASKPALLHFSENGDDLLTQSLQNVYGKQDVQAAYNKTIASDVNSIIKDLGYNYKVAPSQVASVAESYNNVIAPGLQRVENGAVAANIQNPNGPFAALFT